MKSAVFEFAELREHLLQGCLISDFLLHCHHDQMVVMYFFVEFLGRKKMQSIKFIFDFLKLVLFLFLRNGITLMQGGGERVCEQKGKKKAYEESYYNWLANSANVHYYYIL